MFRDALSLIRAAGSLHVALMEHLNHADIICLLKNVFVKFPWSEKPIGHRATRQWSSEDNLRRGRIFVVDVRPPRADLKGTRLVPDPIPVIFEYHFLPDVPSLSIEDRCIRYQQRCRGGFQLFFLRLDCRG